MELKEAFLLFVFVFLLILSLSLLLAIKSDLDENSFKKIKLMKSDYGKCAINATNEKAICSKLSRQNHDNCTLEIRNYISYLVENNLDIDKTEIFNMRKACSSTLKTEMNLCKSNFKDKKDLCDQLK